jgi:hypothetical protein
MSQTASASLKNTIVPSTIYFHETDLGSIRHFFRRPAKTVLIRKHKLFHHKLHLAIQVMCLLRQGLHLVLQSKEHLYQKRLVHCIQFSSVYLNAIIRTLPAFTLVLF